MAPTDLPGLAAIQQWAQFLGIDVADTLNKARLLMQTDPAAVQAGGERLGTVATGLGDSRQGVHLAGSDVASSGWTGESATAFNPRHTELVTGLDNDTTAANQLATQFGEIAKTFAGSQNTVMTATATTATALGMMQG
jgi:hypothetical protein